VADDDNVIPVETFAAKLRSGQLQCRDQGHTWAAHTVRVLTNRGRVVAYERTMKCRSCKSERTQLLDSRGGILRNGYHYTDGYLADHVQRGFGREVFRMESLSRFVEQHPEAVTNEQTEGEF